MGELMRLYYEDEPWEFITMDSQSQAAIEAHTSASNYPRFSVHRFGERRLPDWDKYPSEREIRPQFHGADEKTFARYVLCDGLYVLRWSDVMFWSHLSQTRTTYSSYWKVEQAVFKSVRMSQKDILKEYEAMKARLELRQV